MSFNEEKIQLAKFILDSEDQELIREMSQNFIEVDSNVGLEELPEDIIESLKISDLEEDNGHFISNEEMREKYAEWIKK